MQAMSPGSPLNSRSTEALEPLRPKAALRAIQSQARYLFEPTEFGQLVGRDGGSMMVKKALYRLTLQGLITLVSRRPTSYLIVPAEQMHYGAPPITWWIDDYLKRTEPHYYIALLSAARYWGSAHYAIQEAQVMVSRPRTTATPGKLTVTFFTKRKISGTPAVVVGAGVAPWRVSTRAATLLDLIRHQADVGGIESIARVAKDFSSHLDMRDIELALEAMNQIPVAQRLGFIFDHLNLALPAQKIGGWLRSRRISLQPLVLGDREDDHPLQVNAKWGIRYDPRLLDLLSEIT